jgi:hypothetical protein
MVGAVPLGVKHRYAEDALEIAVHDDALGVTVVPV